jgi:hypothetical protein
VEDEFECDELLLLKELLLLTTEAEANAETEGG